MPAAPVDTLGNEITGSQTSAISFATSGELATSLPATYATYRSIRRNPTIALARQMRVAPVLAASWSIEADDDIDEDWVKFIRSVMLPLRINFLKCAVLGDTDFGWQGFEKVHAVVNNQIRLVKLKPLLQDITIILIQANGSFNGYLQTYSDGKNLVVPVEKVVHVATAVEGSNWYGYPLLENVRDAWNTWRKTEDGAALYDKKIAGAHWLVKFPVGQTLVAGKLTDNATIAASILKALVASSAVSLPVEKQVHPDMPGWSIELMGDSVSRQPSFTGRQEYLDKLFVRGLLFPERSLTEGKYGTKAEAGEHKGLVITSLDLLHRELTLLANTTCVDELLRVNFGEEAVGTVRLVASPLVEERREFLQNLYLKLLSNPAGFLQELDATDTDSLKDLLGIPKSEEIAGGGEMSDNLLELLRRGVAPNGSLSVPTAGA